VSRTERRRRARKRAKRLTQAAQHDAAATVERDASPREIAAIAQEPAYGRAKRRGRPMRQEPRQNTHAVRMDLVSDDGDIIAQNVTMLEYHSSDSRHFTRHARNTSGVTPDAAIPAPPMPDAPQPSDSRLFALPVPPPPDAARVETLKRRTPQGEAPFPRYDPPPSESVKQKHRFNRPVRVPWKPL
jgi:hypothetical protein